MSSAKRAEKQVFKNSNRKTIFPRRKRRPKAICSYQVQSWTCNGSSGENSIWIKQTLDILKDQVQDLIRSVLFLVITIQISTHTFLDIWMISNSKISYSSPNQISSPRAEWNIVESPPFSEIFSPSVETERQTAWKVTTRGKSRLLSPHNKDNDTSATSLVCMHPRC